MPQRSLRSSSSRNDRVRLVLASGSPRRRALLETAGFELRVAPATIDEDARVDEPPTAMVVRLAREKALSVASTDAWNGECALIAADTTVWIEDRQPLGKPADRDEAIAMLRTLAGTSHRVTTAFAIVAPNAPGIAASALETTEVVMRPIDEQTIAAYADTGEPFGKAGSYAIQGLAGTFIERIVGSYDNVVGLPVARVIDALLETGIIDAYPWTRPHE